MPMTQACCRMEVFGACPDGHVFLPDAGAEAVSRYAGAVQLVIVDRPMASSTRFQWKSGAGDWLTNRSSLRLTVHHTTGDGLAEYLSCLETDLKAAKSLLGPTGSVYVFADERTSACVRLLLDEIFGKSNFLNEIIWAREAGLRPAGRFTRSHDTIFLYRTGRRALFNVKAAGRVRGRLKSHMRRSVDGGRAYYTRESAGRVYRYFEDDVVSIGDVWTDIPEIAPKDEERTGWNGQRPLALLERMISASSSPGGIVCAMASASGTVAEAAQRLHRRSLLFGTDALERMLARRRLLTAGASGYEFFHSGETPERQPEIEASLSGSSIQLQSYSLPGSLPEPTGTFLRDGLGSLEYWAAGRLAGGVFTVNASALRTRKQPILPLALDAGDGAGESCAHFVDAGGEEWFYLLR